MIIKDFFRWLDSRLRGNNSFQDIKAISLFSGLSSFQLYELNNYLHTRHYKVGEFIFEQGYPLDAVFFVKSGEVEVTGKISGPSPRILRKDEFIGIVDMFHEGTRSSTALALTDVTALAISKSDLSSLIDRDSDLGIKVLRAICRYLSSLTFSHSCEGGNPAT